MKKPVLTLIVAAAVLFGLGSLASAGSNTSATTNGNDAPLSQAKETAGTTAAVELTGEAKDIDDSPAMHREWDGWHKRVSSELYKRYASLSNAAFGHSLRRLQASASYIVTSDRRILNPTLNIKSSDPIYNTLIIGVIKSLDGSPILEFPSGCKSKQVEKSAIFSQNYGIGDFYPRSVGDFDEKRPDRAAYERMLQYRKQLYGHDP